MQIIIPMSGFGERFRKAGYKVPKPLIDVDGKPIIEYVVRMFPDDSDFVFICNSDHLSHPGYRMQETLERIAPNGKIIGIDAHKLGPAHAIYEARGYIDIDAPTVVNYCDFSCYWQFEKFEALVNDTRCDGVVVAYRGFHPHMLNSVNFAYVQMNGEQVSNIQEKKPFTDDPMSEFASSGTYYFRNGELLLKACAAAFREEWLLGGEYYVSLVYKFLLQQKLDVRVFEVEHFMQWGTPDDLEEYLYYSKMFRSLAEPQDRGQHPGMTLVPMAGLGQRFASEGYKVPKPLIEVSGKAMVTQAVNDLPKSDFVRLITKQGLCNPQELQRSIAADGTKVSITELQQVTDGQASTCALGVTNADLTAPVTIAACDNGAIFDGPSFVDLYEKSGADVIVWVARSYPGATANPAQYGWVAEAGEGDRVTRVLVKKPLEDPRRDLAVTGTFTFKKAVDFLCCYQSLVERDGRVNGEFYVDELINDAIDSGLDVRFFEIQSYICWGTPNDLRRFEYWQACFDKWDMHPYSITKDLDFR